MTIKFYNTLTREEESFEQSKDDPVKLYTCGPTVYRSVHIGNLRTFIFYDVLKRSLKYLGYSVDHVLNITDVGHLSISEEGDQEDKMEEAAKEAGKTPKEVAEFYTEKFLNDMKGLNIEIPPEDHLPRASEYIEEQIKLVEQLEEQDYTYEIDDGIYFDTSKFEGYGEIANLDEQDTLEGVRIEPNPQKKNPADFALWKFSDPDDNRYQEWDSPWGTGYPGWHLECSVMSRKLLGDPLDIHAGGIDLIFPHHANEIAQTEAVTEKPFSKFWLHSEFLMVEGEKMSKSKGNDYTLDDLKEKGYDPLAFRYLVLQSHYRKQMNFTWDAIKAAEKALWRLRYRGLRSPGGEAIEEYKERFKDALEDDLNTPKALEVVWNLVDDQEVSQPDKAATLQDFDQVFGLGLDSDFLEEIPDEVNELQKERDRLREKEKFDEADKIREKIESKGFAVEDTESGSYLIPKEYA